MKKFYSFAALAAIAAAFVFMITGCSPKVAGSIEKEQIPEVHPEYAVIYFYRTGNYVKTPYDVHLNNEVVYRSKNKTKAAVKVYTAGEYEIWGKTESRESLKLKVEMGKEYYVKTFVHFGVAIWRPSIELRDAVTGKAEYDSIN